MKDLSKPQGPAQDFVMKLSKNVREPRQEYFLECRMQATAAWYAEQYNKCQPPTKVRYLEAAVIECHERVGPDGNPAVFAIEQYVHGGFAKYNNNFGWINPKFAHVVGPQAFSHFTHTVSRGALIVVDVQGFQDFRGCPQELYTDPQINSMPPEKPFGKADMRQKGIDKFFSTHRCNEVCHHWDRWLKQGGAVDTCPAALPAADVPPVLSQAGAMPSSQWAQAPSYMINPALQGLQGASGQPTGLPATPGYQQVAGLRYQQAPSYAHPGYGLGAAATSTSPPPSSPAVSQGPAAAASTSAPPSPQPVGLGLGTAAANPSPPPSPQLMRYGLGDANSASQPSPQPSPQRTGRSQASTESLRMHEQPTVGYGQAYAWSQAPSPQKPLGSSHGQHMAFQGQSSYAQQASAVLGSNNTALSAGLPGYSGNLTSMGSPGGGYGLLGQAVPGYGSPMAFGGVPGGGTFSPG